ATVPPRFEWLKQIICSLDAPLDHCLVVLHVAACNEVLLNRKVFEDPPTLKHLGDPSSHNLVRRQSVEPCAVEFDGTLGYLPSISGKHPGNRLQRGGLASAVSAEQCRDRTFLGDKRNTLEHHDDAVVDHFYVVQREHTGPP